MAQGGEGSWSGSLLLPSSLGASDEVTLIMRPLAATSLADFAALSGTLTAFDGGEPFIINDSGLSVDGYAIFEDGGAFRFDFGVGGPCVIVVTSNKGYVCRLFLCEPSDIAALSRLTVPVGLVGSLGDFIYPLLDADSPNELYFNWDSTAEHFQFVCFNPSAADLVLSSDSQAPAHADVKGGAFGLDVQCAGNTSVVYLWQESKWLQIVEI